MGAAEFCFHAALQFALNRYCLREDLPTVRCILVQMNTVSIIRRYEFGTSIASFQLAQSKFSDMITEITIGLQGCVRVGRLKEQSQYFEYIQ